MRNPPPSDSDRAAALALVEEFCRRLLPGALRRLRAWKSIPSCLLAQHREDVEQELYMDGLEHTGAVLTLPPRERHARWMRVAERTLYRLRRHERRCQPLVEEPPSAASDDGAPTIDLPVIVPLENGRANVAESARRAGLGRRSLRRRLDEAAAQLGWGDVQRRFWQARAAEALTGLAADLLRAQRAVHELDDARAVDLSRRHRRLRQIAQRFPVQPSTLRVRRALQPWLRTGQASSPPPQALLARAVELAPQRAAGGLWLFEAACAARDPAAAAAALGRARRCDDAARAALLLARARLLELRGRFDDAGSRLRRAARRRDPDRRLHRALQLAASLTS